MKRAVKRRKMEVSYSILDITHAYFAGFLDGEGCVSTAPASHNHNLTVTIVNSNMKVLELVQEEFGGAIHERKDDNPRHSIIYSWHLTGKPAAAMLEEIYPYLIVKGALAKLGINLMNVRMEERKDIASKIHEINTPHIGKEEEQL